MSSFFTGSVPVGNFSGSYAVANPQIAILKYKSHSEETLSKNGVQKIIHVVVKNSPFLLKLGFVGANSAFDLNQVTFEATLFYDCDESKEVDYVKVKPFEFKAQANEEGGEVDVEIRIKVLTSQHEDMLFKIKIVGYHPNTRIPIPGLTLFSSPVKVISKPEQLKKKAPGKKRTLTEMLMETVVRIEKKQEEQQKLLEKLMTEPQPAATRAKVAQEDLSSLLDLEVPEVVPSKEEAKPLSLEQVFSNMISAYNSLKHEERAEGIRRLVRTSAPQDRERLSELLDLFWEEGLQKDVSRSSTGVGCACGTCPHKAELERIDLFYREFLSSGMGSFS